MRTKHVNRQLRVKLYFKFCQVLKDAKSFVLGNIYKSICENGKYASIRKRCIWIQSFCVCVFLPCNKLCLVFCHLDCTINTFNDTLEQIRIFLYLLLYHVLNFTILRGSLLHVILAGIFFPVILIDLIDILCGTVFLFAILNSVANVTASMLYFVFYLIYCSM